MVCLDLSQVVIVERVASAPARFDKFGFPLRRQTLYPTELRAPKLILKDFPLARPSICHVLTPYCARTVPEFPNSGTVAAANSDISLPCRLIFVSASRCICNFICEYFLKTCESP